jgi:sterol desaturase/sphingolipid hydroxylase (fatty acid hydroxylase superfamily)
MNSDDYALKLVEISKQADSGGFMFNEVLFGLAMLAFVILMVMERLKPYRKFTSKMAKESFVTNTSAFLFNNVLLTLLRASSLFLLAHEFSYFGLLSGLSNGPVKWIISFVLFDLAIYAWHFFSHHNDFMWRFHKVHHSDQSFNVSTGFRFHVFDLLLEIVYKCLFVILIGVQAYVILAIEIIELFFIFFHHANLQFKNENLISQVIITPSLHRTHHSALREEHDSNYGIVLSIWDKIFGTRKELVPEKIGLNILVADNFLQLFFLAFITERHFRRLFQVIPKGKK